MLVFVKSIGDSWGVDLVHRQEGEEVVLPKKRKRENEKEREVRFRTMKKVGNWKTFDFCLVKFSAHQVKHKMLEKEENNIKKKK